MVNHAEGKTKEELLDGLGTIAMPGSIAHEQLKAGISVRCTEDIQQALNKLSEQLGKNSAGAEKMSNRIFWLNCILTLATVLASFGTIFIAFKPY